MVGYYLISQIFLPCLSTGAAKDVVECSEVLEEKLPEGLFLVVNLLWTERMGLSIRGIEINIFYLIEIRT
jgi:hypothetical protein